MFSAIRASQDLSRSGLPWIAKKLFVPVSWPLTALALRLGATPNSVTAFRAGLLLAGVAITPFSLWGIAVYMLAVVLDHVDGALCRLQNAATWFGKFIDGLVDIAGDALFLPAIGAYLLLNGHPSWAAAAAFLGGTMIAFAFIALYRLPLIELQAGVSSWVSINRFLWLVDLHAANLIFNVRYLLLPTVFFFPAHYAVFLAALYLAFSILITAARVKRAHGGLNVSRLSRSARRAQF